MQTAEHSDIWQLADWLQNHIDGFGPLRGVEKFDTGQSNPTYRITGVNGPLVLRTKPPGTLLRSAHMVEREYRVMRALGGSSVPVPRMLGLCGDEQSPNGRAFFVMEHLDGRIFWDPALPELGPSDRGAVYDAMNATLAAIHDIEIMDIGLADFGKPGDYFARQITRWSSQYRASTPQPSPRMEQIMTWLGEQQPGDDGQVSLVHGDYRLDNMVFDPSKPRLIGLLDWELSTLGHPFADLAYQCSQWRLPHGGGLRGLGGLDRAQQGLPDEDDYVADYCRRRGLDGIENWPFYLVFSLFRLAAILEGVVQRARAGNASNPETAKTYGAAIPMLADMAIELIETR